MRFTTKNSVGPALDKFYQENSFSFSKKQKKKIEKISKFVSFDIWGNIKTKVLIGEERIGEKNIASLRVVFGYHQQVTLVILISPRGKVTKLEMEIKELYGQSLASPVFKPRKWKAAAREAELLSERWIISQ